MIICLEIYLTKADALFLGKSGNNKTSAWFLKKLVNKQISQVISFIFSTLTSVHISSFYMDFLNHLRTRLSSWKNQSTGISGPRPISLVTFIDRMKTIVIYRSSMLVVLVVFFFFTVQGIITHSGLPSLLINLIRSAERAVLQYGHAVIKNNW